MASSGAGYDYSPSTFSPDGRIFQVEYANKAVENSGTGLGMHCSNGIVLCVEKQRSSNMLVPHSTSGKRVHSVGKHAGMAFTGFVSDARQLVNRAREEASNYKETYGSHVPPAVLADRMSAYVHYFTCHGALRPFGATAIIGGYDPDLNEHALYMVEPSGVSYQYYGCVAGNGRQACKTEMEKLNLTGKNGSGGDPVTVNEAVKQLARMVYMLYEDKDDAKKDKLELEVSWICEESKWEHAPVPSEIVNEAIEWAKEDIAAAQEEDDDEEDEDDVMED